MKEKEKILITSALPYANGPLHFGHIAGAYLPGDCYARFERLMQNDVLYLCGSDEHGVAITLSAEVAGRSPQEHVDHYHEVIRGFFERLNFSFDHYSRTTWEGHKEPVHQFFLDLFNNGYIEERVTDQLYSESDQRFLADRYVVGECPSCGYNKARGDECPKCGASYEATDLKNPRSKLSNAPLTLKPTKHWFLLLDRFKERLEAWIEEKDWKPNVVNFVKQYIKELRPRAITRDSSWGIPVPLPNTEGKVLYVWFDAPIGYLSSAMEWAKKEGDPEKWKTYWHDPKTKLVHFIGKDNIPFHAVIFPSMVMGQNTPCKLVDELPANEFYMLEGRQFSKSEGWYIDLEDFFFHYTADQIRYYIAATAPETSDSEFTWNSFQQRCNGDLLGKYGNLVNRVLVFAHKNCEGKVPAMENLEEIDREFLEKVKALGNSAKEAYEGFKLRKASQLVMELASEGNVYFDAKQPWKSTKDSSLVRRMQVTIACCLECLKMLALLSSPIIPESAQKTWELLGFTTRLEEQFWGDVADVPILPGQKLQKPKILFERVEDAWIEEQKEKLKKVAEEHQEKDVEPLKENVGIDAVHALDLRVAVVEKVEPIKKSSKLYKIEVSIGCERRTIVSGIKKHYSPEELIGKRVVVVANLNPAKLMGVESQGMLLAGADGANLEIVTVDSLSPGSVVS